MGTIIACGLQKKMANPLAQEIDADKVKERST
jgi:hypothetical protein